MDASRQGRLVLAIEILLGVLPVTIVGGFYGAIGTIFGVTSVLVSLYEHAPSAAFWWLGVLAMAVGGLAGIAGLWVLVFVSELGGTRSARTAALSASAIGVVTSCAALLLVMRNDRPVGWLVIYLLISPIVVACRRGYRLVHLVI